MPFLPWLCLYRLCVVCSLGYSHYLLRATDEMFDQAFCDGSLPGRHEMAVDAHPETLLVWPFGHWVCSVSGSCFWKHKTFQFSFEEGPFMKHFNSSVKSMIEQKLEQKPLVSRLLTTSSELPNWGSWRLKHLTSNNLQLIRSWSLCCYMSWNKILRFVLSLCFDLCSGGINDLHMGHTQQHKVLLLFCQDLTNLQGYTQLI